VPGCSKGTQNRSNSRLLPLCSAHCYARLAVPKHVMGPRGVNFAAYRREFEAASPARREAMAQRVWEMAGR
jgi:hypothetical protein